MATDEAVIPRKNQALLEDLAAISGQRQIVAAVEGHGFLESPRRWKGTVLTRHVVLLSVLFFSYCRRVYLDPVRAQSNRDLRCCAASCEVAQSRALNVSTVVRTPGSLQCQSRPA